MNCHEFDELWNDLLDGETAGRPPHGLGSLRPSPAPSDPELAVSAHARACPRCRPIHERYERLRQALRARNASPRSFPAPSPELARQVLAATGKASRPQQALAGRAARSGPPRRPRRSCWRSPPRSCPGVWIGLPSGPRGAIAGRAADTGPAPRSAHPPRGGDLTEALAEATEATWDLARTTSGPAARLGRQVLVAAASVQDADSEGGGATAAATPRMGLDALAQVLRVVPDATPGSELIQKVGDGLTSSVRPLSSSARQAFGFLRTPALGKPDNPISIPPAASKGA